MGATRRATGKGGRDADPDRAPRGAGHARGLPVPGLRGGRPALADAPPRVLSPAEWPGPPAGAGDGRLRLRDPRPPALPGLPGRPRRQRSRLAATPLRRPATGSEAPARPSPDLGPRPLL